MPNFVKLIYFLPVFYARSINRLS